MANNISHIFLTASIKFCEPTSMIVCQSGKNLKKLELLIMRYETDLHRRKEDIVKKQEVGQKAKADDDGAELDEDLA